MSASHRKDETNAGPKMRYVDIEAKFIDEFENLVRVARLLAIQEGADENEKAYLSAIERLVLECLDQLSDEDSAGADPQTDANTMDDGS
jgi:hypothetical protein